MSFVSLKMTIYHTVLFMIDLMVKIKHIINKDTGNAMPIEIYNP